MPILTLSNEQVIELVKQLPIEQQNIVFQFLLSQQWPSWDGLSKYGANQARTVANLDGLDWDRMTEIEREAWINQLVHEV
ncbi:hypothetical protein [Synechococcus sp. PCC 6312]|uniref:hypothetical protein n=1 Tax=Synechococcus sp. (strain ATCC 27167 / PCC 6312) TaxID=195253 RepID=UPI00029EE111|nr:hypothetical protein [Synechococcus sp. PCC 6312]AFY59655.1 hypothetical protein Syn6312_0426 [Synechococcus sp. PCC 6312]